MLLFTSFNYTMNLRGTLVGVLSLGSFIFNSKLLIYESEVIVHETEAIFTKG